MREAILKQLLMAASRLKLSKRQVTKLKRVMHHLDKVCIEAGVQVMVSFVIKKEDTDDNP